MSFRDMPNLTATAVKTQPIAVLMFVGWIIFFPIKGTPYQILLYALPILALIQFGTVEKLKNIAGSRFFLLLLLSLLTPIIPTLISNLSDLNADQFADISSVVTWRMVIFTFALALIFSGQKQQFINLTFQTLIYATTIVALIGIIIFLYQTVTLDGAVPARVASIYTNPNRFGFMVAVSLLATLVFRSRMNKWIWPVCIILLTAALLLSGNRSSWVGFIGSAAVMIFLSSKNLNAAKIRSGLGILLLMSVAALPFIFLKAEAIERSGNMTTVDARIGIWKHHWNKGLEKPFFGHGEHIDVYHTREGLKIHHVHNNILQTFYTFGIFGLLALIILIFTAFFILYRDNELRNLIPIFSMLPLNGLFGPSLYTSKIIHSMYAILFAIALIHTLTPIRPESETPS